MANLQPTESNQESIKIILSTYPDQGAATSTGRSLVENGIAACVNIVPIATSLYQWEGKIVEDAECYLIAKCINRNVQEAVLSIQRTHPYSTPFIGVTDCSVENPAYKEWMEKGAAPLS